MKSLGVCIHVNYMGSKQPHNSKWLTSCLLKFMAPRNFFVHLGQFSFVQTSRLFSQSRKRVCSLRSVRELLGHHSHTVQQNVIIVTTKHHQGVKAGLNTFKVVLTNIFLIINEDKKLDISVATRWLFTEYWLVHDGSLVQHDKSGEDWIMFIEIITVLCFMAKNQNVSCWLFWPNLKLLGNKL